MLDPAIMVLVCVLIVGLIIFIRGKVIDSLVWKHSEKVKSVIKLNNETVFHSIKDTIEVQKYYDNKGSYLKIEPAYVMSSYLRNNLAEFSTYANKVKENRTKKQLYDKQIALIKSQSSKEYYHELKITRNEYTRRENILIEKIKVHPTVECICRIHMSYSSPKGQVQLSKSATFSFNDLVVSYESVSRSYLDKDIYERLALVERGEISDSMRYDILNRDDFKCVICGASSREGARLHVDHIIPVSKGGKSTLSNLRTLCERCNVGKSNKIELDTNIDSTKDHLSFPVCPICGAKLVLRHGKNGEFYGCSNFPKCKYTKNL